MSDDCCTNKHPSHKDEIKRLNRVSGQINGIIKMIDEQRYCPDILTQLKAVQAATKAVEANILERHIKACVREGVSSTDNKVAEEKISELIDIFKRN